MEVRFNLQIARLAGFLTGGLKWEDWHDCSFRDVRNSGNIQNLSSRNLASLFEDVGMDSKGCRVRHSLQTLTG